jgi:hypothetical protein
VPLVPKKIFLRKLFLTTSPPPRRQIGQCTILGVQEFFGHTQIFRKHHTNFPDITKFAAKLTQFLTKFTEFVPFFVGA